MPVLLETSRATILNTKEAGGRNVQLDLFRLVLATLVLLAHAPEISDGNRHREIFSRLTHSGMSFGEVGVDGFFLISGFLILQSWQRQPLLATFLRKRALRIVPGYLVAALLSTLVIGLLAPCAPAFFHRLMTPRFFESLATLSEPMTPQVFPGLPYHVVNGSLWTITYEFRCYLLVAGLGSLGLLHRYFWLGATVVLAFAFLAPIAHQHIYWSSHTMLFGDPHATFRLTFAFFVGGCFYLFGEQVAFQPLIAAAAILGLALSLLAPTILEVAVVLFGGYLIFYFHRSRANLLPAIKGLPDISYGVYLYGWPVQCLWTWLFRSSPWTSFIASLPICALLGICSWYFVERPALAFKRAAAH